MHYYWHHVASHNQRESAIDWKNNCYYEAVEAISTFARTYLQNNRQVNLSVNLIDLAGGAFGVKCPSIHAVSGFNTRLNPWWAGHASPHVLVVSMRCYICVRAEPGWLGAAVTGLLGCTLAIWIHMVAGFSSPLRPQKWLNIITINGKDDNWESPKTGLRNTQPYCYNIDFKIVIPRFTILQWSPRRCPQQPVTFSSLYPPAWCSHDTQYASVTQQSLVA